MNNSCQSTYFMYSLTQARACIPLRESKSFLIFLLLTLLQHTGIPIQQFLSNNIVENLNHNYVQIQAPKTAAYYISPIEIGILWEAKPTLKVLLASWYLKYFFKQFRSFIAEILKSLDQMVPKLPVVKVRGLTKKSAIQPWPHSN